MIAMMALAAWIGQNDVWGGDGRPISLEQILANMNLIGIVGAVPFDGYAPFVDRHEDLDLCGARRCSIRRDRRTGR